MFAALILAGAGAGCSAHPTSSDASGAKEEPGAQALAADLATPVEVAPLRRASLVVEVSGPGETAALHLDKVRAPFAGTMVALNVQDGDRVETGQVLGRLASRESTAAVDGARAMARSAQSAQDRDDAQRALALAEKSLVEAPLRAPGPGVVVSHQANLRALVAADEEILAIAGTDAISFIATLVQSDLPKVKPGDVAQVELPAIKGTRAGVVHSVLALSDAKNFSAKVRIDFTRGTGPGAPGLFGTARIAVAERRKAQVVPAAAVLRDDITGVTRVATVTADRKAHWIEVQTGLVEGGSVEITSPQLPPDTRVVTTGLVGLPEGAPVKVRS